MSITVTCWQCGKKLLAADKSAGRRVNCPACKAEVPVPRRAAVVPEPLPAGGSVPPPALASPEPSASVPAQMRWDTEAPPVRAPLAPPADEGVPSAGEGDYFTPPPVPRYTPAARRKKVPFAVAAFAVPLGLLAGVLLGFAFTRGRTDPSPGNSSGGYAGGSGQPDAASRPLAAGKTPSKAELRSRLMGITDQGGGHWNGAPFERRRSRPQGPRFVSLRSVHDHAVQAAFNVGIQYAAPTLRAAFRPDHESTDGERIVWTFHCLDGEFIIAWLPRGSSGNESPATCQVIEVVAVQER